MDNHAFISSVTKSITKSIAVTTKCLTYLWYCTSATSYSIAERAVESFEPRSWTYAEWERDKKSRSRVQATGIVLSMASSLTPKKNPRAILEPLASFKDLASRHMYRAPYLRFGKHDAIDLS